MKILKLQDTTIIKFHRSSSSNNIPLQRVVQSFRNVKVASGNIIRSDWVIWWTNLNYSVRKLIFYFKLLIIKSFIGS